jgi:hypothetical protein
MSSVREAMDYRILSYPDEMNENYFGNSTENLAIN